MKASALLIILTVILGSCASIFNKWTTKINVHADKPTTLIVDEKTYQVNKKTKIKVSRRNAILVLVATTDSLKNEILLKPENSFIYYANILSYGLGFIWDQGDKRYTYPKNVYVDSPSTTKIIPAYKKQSNLMISLPWVNSFYLQPRGEPSKTSTGFMGLAVSLNNYYQEKKIIALRVGAGMDHLIPAPGPFDPSGEYEIMSSVYASFTDNFQFKKISIGYGLNYSKNIWNLRHASPILPHARDDAKKSNQTIGLAFNGYHRIGKHFHIGIIYRPNFITMYPTTEFKYEHLISVDIAWKIRLRN
jgi:hypothetical protein